MHKSLNKKETLAQIGEQELINRLAKFLNAQQISDDTAEITTNQNKLLINTDVLVEGTHFSEQTTKASDVGCSL